MKFFEQHKELIEATVGVGTAARADWADIDAAGPVLVDLENVARYEHAQREAGKTQWDVDDYPCLASPFPLAFYEYPAVALTSYRAGIWVEVVRIGVEEWEVLRHSLLKSGTERRATVMESYAGDAPNFVQSMTLFVEARGRCGPVFRFTFFLNEWGGLIPELTCGSVHGKINRDAASVSREASMIMTPAFLGLSFLHCKNIELVDRPVPPKLARARMKRGQHPGLTYKELRIEPMRKVLATEGRSGEVGLKRALHICRGHFATYSPERPLFGKHSGTFWVPAHVRGSKDAGEVKKSYKVAAPPKEGA